MFPVAKLVVLYACVSYREGSRGRPYVFNVDHSVKRCNINVITLLPTNHKLDHFYVLLSLYGLVRVRAVKSCWKKRERRRRRKRQKLVNISKRYFYRLHIKITKRYYILYSSYQKPISLEKKIYIYIYIYMNLTAIIGTLCASR